MGFLQVNAWSAEFLPQVGNCIQADDGCTFTDVRQKHVQHLEQHHGLPEIQIDLIGTERRPDVSLASIGLHLGKQWKAAGPRHLAYVGVR